MSENMRSATVATDETANLISADKITGTSVYNPQGENLGSIYGIMINKVSGPPSAIVCSAAFWAWGRKLSSTAWRALRYDTSQGGYVVDIDRNRLEKAPHYGTHDTLVGPEQAAR